ncbi:hypothetical protein N9P76_06125 [Amylibacter sp.]|nr:hypothetical protein [Amylibacter sp.]
MRKLILSILLLLFSTQVFAGINQWTYSSKVDAFTDETISTAKFYTGRYNEYVIVRCKNGDFDVYIGFGEYIDNEGAIKAMYRVDSGQVRESRDWTLSTEGTSIFAKEGSNVKLASELINGKEKAVFRVYDYQGTPHTMKINLKGSTKTISKVMGDCNTGIGNKDKKTLFNKAPSKKLISKLYYECVGLNNSEVLSFRVDRRNDGSLSGVDFSGSNTFNWYFKGKKISDDKTMLKMRFGMLKIYLDYANSTARTKSWAIDKNYVCE